VTSLVRGAFEMGALSAGLWPLLSELSAAAMAWCSPRPTTSSWSTSAGGRAATSRPYGEVAVLIEGEQHNGAGEQIAVAVLPIGTSPPALLCRDRFCPQPHAASVWCQHARVVEQLTERFPAPRAVV
jgi:hypothetical protein